MRPFPLDPKAATELVSTFREVLAYSNVQAKEHVLIHTDTGLNPFYPSACLAAAQLLGAEAMILTAPIVRPEGNSEFLLEAWRQADLVVDMVSTSAHAYNSSLNQAADTGTRILRVAEPIDCLLQLLPDPDIRQECRHYARLLEHASEVHLTSNAGTDLVVNKVGRPGAAYYGMADEPGRWDHWPSGLVACAPIETSAEGILVIEPGDVFLSWQRMVETPIRCTFRDGIVVKIEGDADARWLEKTIVSFDDERARVLGIVGWGVRPTARWHRILDRLMEPGGIMDTETFAGNLLLVVGSNTSVSLEGQNATPAHINVNCRNQSIYLDGHVVVDAGRVVEGAARGGTND
jgi:2,5-dihydroxypyridine 5,6-dioxygenase